VSGAHKRWPARIVRWLQLPGVFAWRFFTGKELDGVPRTDATWMARGTAVLDRDKAPRPAASLRDEIRGDVAQAREEFELRRIARRVEDEEKRPGPGGD
jgi:hypothetical protein